MLPALRQMPRYNLRIDGCMRRGINYLFIFQQNDLGALVGNLQLLCNQVRDGTKRQQVEVMKVGPACYVIIETQFEAIFCMGANATGSTVFEDDLRLICRVFQKGIEVLFLCYAFPTIHGAKILKNAEGLMLKAER